MTIKLENRAIRIKQDFRTLKFYHSLTGYIFISIKYGNKFRKNVRLDRDEVQALKGWLNAQENLGVNK